MFGIKLKDRPEEKVETEQIEQEVQPVEQIEQIEQLEQIEQVQEVQVEPEIIPQKEETDKFSLAGLLGKTESGMKLEFYAYQIKELMQSVGKIMPRNGVNVSDIDNAYCQTVKYGGKEISVTPYFYRACKELESKYGYGKVEFSAMIDYPFGESSQKARLTDVKEAIKNGVDLVTVVMPFNAYTMGVLNAEKVKLNKLCKVRKGKVGIAVGIDYDAEGFCKIVRLVEGLKCSHITLLCQSHSVDKIVDAIKIIRERKFTKKVYVYSSVKTIEELSKLMELKVDKVYTEHLEQVGFELERKFGVEL